MFAAEKISYEDKMQESVFGYQTIAAHFPKGVGSLTQ